MHAREMHVHEIHACDIHAHEVHACEMHVYEVHAHEIHANGPAFEPRMSFEPNTSPFSQRTTSTLQVAYPHTCSNVFPSLGCFVQRCRQQ